MTGDGEARRRLSRPSPQGAIIAVLAFTGLGASFMMTLVVPIQAELPTLLNASRDDTAWVVTSTLLAAAAITPVAGRLGDMYGKRRIVLVLLAMLVAGSIVAALSSSLVGVIAGRALQGAAMGVIPLGISILRDVLHPARLDSAIALLSATLGVGGALGLPVSALISENADWHLLFWAAAAIGAIGFVLVFVVVPVSVLRTPARFDFVGAIGLVAGLLAVLLAVSRGADWGWLSAPTLALGVGGAFVLLAWGWYELRTRDPLLDLRVAARRPVLLTNLASVAMGFGLFSSNVAYPQLLELPASTGVGFGLSLLGASLVVMPAGVVMMLLSPVSGRLAGVVGPRVLLAAGAVAVAASYAFVLATGTEVWHILVANILVGVGIGLSYAAMPMLIMRSVPANETGASNGLNALARSVGTSVAAAVVGTILAALATPFEGTQVPTQAAFDLTFALGIAAAIAALVLALFIPRHGAEQHPSLPE